MVAQRHGIWAITIITINTSISKAGVGIVDKGEGFKDVHDNHDKYKIITRVEETAMNCSNYLAVAGGIAPALAIHH
jgi:tRNA A37 threonylcarbamoyltransferase TsaD